MRATISDIAARLGFSKSTVSIGLRDDRRLPPATRELIHATAAEMGYRPDPSLASIAALRWRRSEHDTGISVGLLTNHHEPAQDIRVTYLSHARRRLDALGYHAQLFDLDDQPTPGSTNRILQARGIRGLIFPPVYDPEVLQSIELDRFSLAACGIGQWRPTFSTASIDVFDSVTLALSTMAAYGYRRIGVALLRHAQDAPDDPRRLGAAHAAAENLRPSGVDIHILEIPAHTMDNASVDHIRQWHRDVRPEAILGFNHFALTWLKSSGLRCPEDFAYAVLNRTGGSANLAGIDPQHQRIGETAAELLDQQIRLNRAGIPAEPPTIVLVPPRWVDAPSLPRRDAVAKPAAKRRPAKRVRRS